MSGYRFQPGDVLAFRGREFISRAISLGTYLTTGPWLATQLPPSHVGIIAQVRRAPLLVESTSLSKRACLETAKLRDGVQVQDPMARIADYGGRCEVWRLAPMWRLSDAESELLSKIILDYFVTEHHVGYDTLRAAVSGTECLRLLGHPDPYKSFCSELVYALLARLGRLPTDNPARYNPARLMKVMRRCGVARREVTHWVGSEPYLVE